MMHTMKPKVARKRQQQHSVRFADMATMFLVPRWEEDAKIHMWWLPEDHSKFKQNAKEMARELRRRTSMAEYVSQGYDWAREISCETKGEASLTQRLRGLPLHRSLSCWSAGNHELRGLERFVSRVANYHVKQAALAKSKFGFLQRTDTSDDESIRFLAEKESRTSRIFARMMGLADAAAALAYYEEDEEEVYKLEQELLAVESDDEPVSLRSMEIDAELAVGSDLEGSNISPLQCIAAGRAA